MRVGGRVSARIVCALAAVAAIGWSVAGCGDEGSEPGGPAPATLVPGDVPLYLEGAVRPEGDLRDDVESALGDLLGTEDVGARITDELDSSFAEDDLDLTYADDVEPWLGERAGIFFTNFEEEADGAAVLTTSDQAAAEAALDRFAEEQGVRAKRAVDGIDYTVTEEDDAVGIVDGFAVFGSEAGFRAVVQASGGDSLADSEAFEDATGDAPDGTAATVYALPDRVLDGLAAAGEITPSERDDLAASLGDAADAPATASVGAADSGFFAELTLPSVGDASGAKELLERVPDDAWIAVGLSDSGPTLGALVAAIQSAGPEVAAALRRAESEIGTDLDEIGDSIGDAAAYFKGSSPLGVGGAVIAEVRDEARVDELLDGLGAALSADPSVRVSPGDEEGEAFSVSPADAPVEFPFVLRDDLLAIGLGPDSIDQVYEPESSLTDSEVYDDAQSALGDDFSLVALLDFDATLEFFEAIPDATEDPDFKAALPYIERMSLLAAGVRSGEETSTVRFALGLDDDGSGGVR
jgi:Protein of unknown function (DUF3352)